MSVAAVWNPTATVIGSEFVPDTARSVTVSGNTGIAWRVRPGAVNITKLHVYVAAASGSPQLEAEVLTELTNTSAAGTTRILPVTELDYVNVVNNALTTVAMPTYIDDDNGGTGSYLACGADSPGSWYTVKGSGIGSHSGKRIRDVGLDMWYRTDAAGIYAVSLTPRLRWTVSGTPYHYYPWGALPGGSSAFAQLRTQTDPQTVRPWEAGDIVNLEGFGWIATHPAVMGVYFVHDITEVVRWYTTDNRKGHGYQLVNDTTAGTWVTVDISDTGTLTAGTDYWVHLFCPNGSVVVPYFTAGQYPSGTRFDVSKTTLEGASGCIASSSSLGVGYLPCIPELATASVSTASWSGSQATYTTSAAHGLSVGQAVTVSGVTPSGYNATGEVNQVPGSTQLRLYVAANPGAYSSGGTVTPASEVAVSHAELDGTEVYSGATADVTVTTPSSKVVGQLRAAVRWQSLSRPDGPLRFRVGTAASGGGTKRAAGTVAADTRGISGGGWSVVTVPLGAGYTTSAETVYVYVSSDATDGAGWQVAFLDDRSDVAGGASQPTVALVDLCNWTGGIRTDGGNDQAGSARYDCLVELLAVPAPPAPAAAAAVAGVSVTKTVA